MYDYMEDEKMNRYYEEDQKLFQVVSNLKAGDMDSYYIMYDLSIKYIYKIVFDLIKDYHTTEDLVQETYLTIYNKINTLQDVTKFYSWAGRIATNLTLRYIQKNNRELLMLDSEDGASEFAFEVATQDNEEFIPENILMDREKQRLITEIIDGLSVEQKITVQYFYYEEMSVTEIAEAMECSRGTVMSRLNYARKAIKAAVVDLAENKGTRLYSLSALPLFHILFRYAVDEFMFAGAATAGAAMVGATTTAVGAGEGVSAMMGAKATGEGAAEMVGSTLVNSGEGMGAIEMSASMGKGAAVGGTSSAGSAVAAGVGKGILGKVGATLGGKIAVGLVSTGLVVAGGLAIHNVVTEDDKPKTKPMVIRMESAPNNETADDLEDRFSYEYINVTYNDEEITIGFDSEIYQYGYDLHETLSPELEEIHEAEYDNAVNADEEDLKEVFDKEIEFTIDNEEFTLHVNNVMVEYDEAESITTIIITGDCEIPENVEEIYEKYHTAYEEKLAELIAEAAAVQAEWDAKNELVREYFMGVLQDFYLYNTDPFGNKLEYFGNYAQEVAVSVTDYAIADVDGDGLVELVVRLNQLTQGAIVYGYNPDTQMVVEEYRCGGGVFIGTDNFYDSGFLVETYSGYVNVIRCDENTDVYNKEDVVWHCMSHIAYIYGEIGSYAYNENKNNPEYIAQEEELLNTYDKDGNGSLWVEVEYTENHERILVAVYDGSEYTTKLKQYILGGKLVEMEYLDISTIAENIDMTDMGDNQYMKIVEDFYLYQTDPFGNYYEHEERQGWSETYDYAICDMDGDGVDELIIRYGSYIKIYEYDSNSMQVKEEYSWTAEVTTVNAIEFYENGYYMFHYDGIGIYKWDAVSGGSEFIWNCNDNWSISWYQSPYGMDSETESEYLALYDKDGDGTIYYEEIVDENYMVSDVIFYDNAELEGKISEYTGGSKPLDIQFIDMSTVVNQ